MPSDQYEEFRKTAESVYDHVYMLWDDQVKLADTLVGKRRLYSAMLAVLIGLGLFRIDMARPRDNIPEVCTY